MRRKRKNKSTPQILWCYSWVRDRVQSSHTFGSKPQSLSSQKWRTLEHKFAQKLMLDERRWNECTCLVVQTNARHSARFIGINKACLVVADNDQCQQGKRLQQSKVCDKMKVDCNKTSSLKSSDPQLQQMFLKQRRRVNMLTRKQAVTKVSVTMSNLGGNIGD